jgi:hypothetical protein
VSQIKNSNGIPGFNEALSPATPCVGATTQFVCTNGMANINVGFEIKLIFFQLEDGGGNVLVNCAAPCTLLCTAAGLTSNGQLIQRSNCT